jgi:DNA-binding NarL/FixJ family response regulator
MNYSEVNKRMFESALSPILGSGRFPADHSVKPVLVCDTQPVAIEGIRGLLNNSGDLRFAGAVNTLEAAFELAVAIRPAVVILDKYFGVIPILEWLHRFGSSGATAAPVIYGAGLNESEALRFLQAGARGVLRRSSEPEKLLTCLRTVIDGTSWLEDGIFGQVEASASRRSALTPREIEITRLVEQGLRNRDIARNLGIQTGTVKIHLKHIFEKTGVRGRYGLALNGFEKKAH